MKRSFQDQLDSLTMAHCLTFLSQGRATTPFNLTHSHSEASTARVFECKTCSRQFPSFQALGGHRASHKKPRLVAGEAQYSPARPKSHECSVCGLEFAIGQALGGHMRRHRAVIADHQNAPSKTNSARVLCLDLNLTPFENDPELFQIARTTPLVNCFL